jgi:hypothetical protein
MFFVNPHSNSDSCVTIEINPDGHCLFSAIGDQLALLGIIPPSQAGHPTVRYVASNYIYTHPHDFLPFLPSAEGEDGAGATNSGFMSPAAFERYCVAIRDTAIWGGEPEILALSRAYNVPIHVIQGAVPPVVVHNPTGAPQDGNLREKRVLRISYHRKMYGLGEVRVQLNFLDCIPTFLVALQLFATEYWPLAAFRQTPASHRSQYIVISRVSIWPVRIHRYIH